jgi:hypothetical protein
MIMGVVRIETPGGEFNNPSQRCRRAPARNTAACVARACRPTAESRDDAAFCLQLKSLFRLRG